MESKSRVPSFELTGNKRTLETDKITATRSFKGCANSYKLFQLPSKEL